MIVARTRLIDDVRGQRRPSDLSDFRIENLLALREAIVDQRSFSSFTDQNIDHSIDVVTRFGDHSSQSEQLVPVGFLIVGTDRCREAVRSRIALDAHAANLFGLMIGRRRRQFALDSLGARPRCNHVVLLR